MVNIKYLLNAESFAVLLFYLIELNNALAVLELEEMRFYGPIARLKHWNWMSKKKKTLRCAYEILFITSLFFQFPKKGHISL
jgi:hypothetical protein